MLLVFQYSFFKRAESIIIAYQTLTVSFFLHIELKNIGRESFIRTASPSRETNIQSVLCLYHRTAVRSLYTILPMTIEQDIPVRRQLNILYLIYPQVQTDETALAGSRLSVAHNSIWSLNIYKALIVKHLELRRKPQVGNMSAINDINAGILNETVVIAALENSLKHIHIFLLCDVG